MEWIDIHAHLNMLEEGVEAAIANAKAAGVRKIITIGTEPGDHPIVLDIARKYYPDVYCTLGVHPHDGKVYTEEAGRFIEEHSSEPCVVAIGEIGLDYYYDQSPREQQKEAFRAQLEIAKRTKLPIEIHTRDAEEDTIEILKEFKGEVTGLVHCFTGTEWLAKQALDVGLNISISGVVTFKNADSLRATVKMLPLDRIHVETDAPFLAPIPMRGKKNTPAYVVHTAKFVAELKGISEEQLCEQTRINALKMFPKIKW
ncbi:hydrolase TatD [Bdellovibrio bacteriovorus]|uniref:Hydrolase TatD n=1 Tax=Bdellovibrio bacteriovorus TaxID=959 RepID=A0A150WKF8_BDEBC|nr:TatD family hydrolase [Bdellovibrio bacteriovorus]KYG62640.1 hydrolase TatD [Bdellovibrio bacteriovorus]KYG64489.1 hydrolase TatD [Bdellovibrio bacteriovorus]